MAANIDAMSGTVARAADRVRALAANVQAVAQTATAIKEIAGRCGFADSNYFCRLFRQKTDRSPSEYRIHYHSRAES